MAVIETSCEPRTQIRQTPFTERVEGLSLRYVMCHVGFTEK